MFFWPIRARTSAESWRGKPFGQAGKIRARAGCGAGQNNWLVRSNGKTVLTRSARREMQFNYDGRKPVTYTIHLTEGGDTPVSNVIDYTLSEEAAQKLGPRLIDDDFDGDGARNPLVPRGQ